jgi:recombination endonuclease VII
MRLSSEQVNKHRNRQYLALYGITVEDYDRLFVGQKGKCAVCGKHQNGLKKRLFVDHNHITGVIRGLLCCSCNAKVGALECREYPLLIAYLKHHQNKAACATMGPNFNDQAKHEV